MDRQTGTAATIDLGLVLAGAVSGGAYTAGVLDCLVEALDAWHSDARPHAVHLRVLAGTSSGALTAAIFSASANRRFPAVPTADAGTAANPLYDGWVNMTDIVDLLGTADARLDGVQSVLDPTRLNEATRHAIDHGVGLPQVARRWLADPLRLLVTLSNLDGVPFASGPTANAGPAPRRHADVMRHVISGLGGTARPDPPTAPDEYSLRMPDDPLDKWATWAPLAAAALGSAAFPLALPARWIQRPASDQDHLQVLCPQGAGHAPEVRTLCPDAGLKRPTQSFQALDGGLSGPRSPVALAREVLAGRDPRTRWPAADEAAPWVLVEVDPQCEAMAPASGGVAGFLVRQLGLQTLWDAPDVAARQTLPPGCHFRLAPAGPGRQGRGTAGGFLGGFGGYLARAFRQHDFLLGRRDTQAFLAQGLLLPAEHPLFAAWSVELRARHATASGCLPVIPLADHLRPPDGGPVAPPEWPWGAADVPGLRRPLRRRVRVLLAAAVRSRPAWLRLLVWLLAWLIAHALAAWLARRLSDALRRHDLA